MVLDPSPAERDLRDQVVRAINEDTIAGRTVKLPAFDPSIDQAGQFALQSVGIEPNAYGGSIAEYRYQFEGEEDLLHLLVARTDGQELTPTEGQTVASFVLGSVPPALVWFKPGKYSQHFYLGHDVLLQYEGREQAP